MCGADAAAGILIKGKHGVLSPVGHKGRRSTEQEEEQGRKEGFGDYYLVGPLPQSEKGQCNECARGRKGIGRQRGPISRQGCSSFPLIYKPKLCQHCGCCATDTIGPKAPLIEEDDRQGAGRLGAACGLRLFTRQAGRQIKQLLSVEQMFALQ